MKRVHLLGNSWICVDEEPKPHVQPGWILVQMKAIPICGSDLSQFLRPGADGPAGHEGAGVVVEAGTETGFTEGDRVIVPTGGGCGKCGLCQDGNYIYCTSKEKQWPTPTQAEFCLAPWWLTLRAPEELDFAQASLAGCATAPGYAALQRSRTRAGQWVVVTGAGPVGLGTAFMAARMGCRVVAIDRSPARIEIARSIGVEAGIVAEGDELVGAVREATRGAAIGTAVECSGSSAARRVLLTLVGPLGSVAIVGESNDELALRPSDDLIRRGVNLFGQWHANLRHLREIVALLVLHREDLHWLIGPAFPLERAAEAYELAATRSTAKVMLTA